MALSTVDFASFVAQAVYEKMLRSREIQLYRGAYSQVVNKGVDGSDRVDCIEVQLSDLTRFCLYLEVRSVSRESIGKTEPDRELFDNVGAARKADAQQNGPPVPAPMFDKPAKPPRRKRKKDGDAPDDPAEGLGEDEPEAVEA